MKLRSDICAITFATPLHKHRKVIVLKHRRQVSLKEANQNACQATTRFKNISSGVLREFAPPPGLLLGRALPRLCYHLQIKREGQLVRHLPLCRLQLATFVWNEELHSGPVSPEEGHSGFSPSNTGASVGISCFFNSAGELCILVPPGKFS